MVSPVRIKNVIIFTLILILTVNCTSRKGNKKSIAPAGKSDSCFVTLQAEDFTASKTPDIIKVTENNTGYGKTGTAGWLEYKLDVPEAGRYRIRLFGTASDSLKVACWIEDHVDNKDGRTYNITGNMMLKGHSTNDLRSMVEKDGSPLDSGLHIIRLHYDTGTVTFDKICFELLRRHKISPVIFTQKTSGKEWKLVWSDEFNGTGLPDSTKWAYDIGNWGWGNNEL